MDEHHTAVVTVDPSIGTLYTTAQVATILHVSQHTVQTWIRNGMLPAIRYGRVLRIRQADLVAFGEVLSKSTPAPAGAAHE
jgi:excisionase family DNA binding protein